MSTSLHDYIKGIDSTPILLDNPMPCAVQHQRRVQRVLGWRRRQLLRGGRRLREHRHDGGRDLPSYGHGINDFTYIAHGAGSGMGNGALHCEGLADVNAAFLTDDPVIGDGFTGRDEPPHHQ